MAGVGEPGALASREDAGMFEAGAGASSDGEEAEEEVDAESERKSGSASASGNGSQKVWEEITSKTVCSLLNSASRPSTYRKWVKSTVPGSYSSVPREGA